MINRFSYLLFIWPFWMLLSCAQQGILTGGDKDSSPPQIDSTKLEHPPNGSVHFSATKIVIPFNEFVVLQDVRKQVIITPFISTAPKIYAQGKKVIVEFESPLMANTTYIINFGDAIRDITEGNKLSNYKYVFSTGSFLDSLQYTAYVYDAYSKKSVAGALVMLYQETADSVVKKQKPMYFAKTGPNGMCKIENIGAHTYKVFALVDGNDNYLWDQKDEKIGFLSNPITIDSTFLHHTDSIAVFVNIPDKKQIDNSTFNNGLITVALNTPLLDSNWNEVITSPALWKDKVHINATKDTLRWWISPLAYKKHDVEFSLLGYGKDKVRIAGAPEEKPLEFTTNVAANLIPGELVEITLKQPIELVDTSKIFVWKDEISQPFSVFQKNETTLVISSRYEVDENYVIDAHKGAFTSIYGQENDSITLLFSCQHPNKYGAVKLHLTGPLFDEPKGNWIVLVRQGEKTMYRLHVLKNSNKELFFEHLVPGKYEISVIFDDNENGIWDTGDYFSGLFPENIYYYPEMVEVRKGWDIELFWELGKSVMEEEE